MTQILAKHGKWSVVKQQSALAGPHIDLYDTSDELNTLWSLDKADAEAIVKALTEAFELKKESKE